MKKLYKYLIWKIKGMKERPPKLYKELLIKKYAKRYGIENFVETGTYEGETVNAMKSFFKEIYSIELDQQLWWNACHRFKKYTHIDIILGDSAERLPILYLDKPTIFWLDAHYSGGKTAKSDNPLLEELRLIVKHSNKHIILVDDADHYAFNIPKIKKIIGKDYSFKIENNIMRITPR